MFFPRHEGVVFFAPLPFNSILSPVGCPKVSMVNQTPQSPYIMTLFVVMTAITSFVVPVKYHLPNNFYFVKGSTYLPWSLRISGRTFGNNYELDYLKLELLYFCAKIGFVGIKFFGYTGKIDVNLVELDAEGVYF